MLFQKRQDFPAQKTGLALGTQNDITITREFMIESINLRVSGTMTTAAATISPDTILALVKRVEVIVADGARTRSVINASGIALVQYAKQCGLSLDRNTLVAIVTNGTAAFEFTIPIPFALPQLDDPIGMAFLLPTRRFSQDVILRVTLASQADLDVNATPTSATTGGITLTALVNRREVDIENWPVWDTELTEYTQTYPSTTTPARWDIPTPGHITSILHRGYTSASALGDITNGGTIGVGILNTNLRRALFKDLVVENDQSQSQTAANQYFGGTVFFDFLNDRPGAVSGGGLGSVLDTYPAAKGGTRPYIEMSTAVGGTAVQFKALIHRIYGDIRALKAGAK